MTFTLVTFNLEMTPSMRLSLVSAESASWVEVVSLRSMLVICSRWSRSLSSPRPLASLMSDFSLDMPSCESCPR